MRNRNQKKTSQAPKPHHMTKDNSSSPSKKSPLVEGSTGYFVKGIKACFVGCLALSAYTFYSRIQQPDPCEGLWIYKANPADQPLSSYRTLLFGNAHTSQSEKHISDCIKSFVKPGDHLLIEQMNFGEDSEASCDKQSAKAISDQRIKQEEGFHLLCNGWDLNPELKAKYMVKLDAVNDIFNYLFNSDANTFFNLAPQYIDSLAKDNQKQVHISEILKVARRFCDESSSLAEVRQKCLNYIEMYKGRDVWMERQASLTSSIIKRIKSKDKASTQERNEESINSLPKVVVRTGSAHVALLKPPYKATLNEPSLDRGINHLFSELDKHVDTNPYAIILDVGNHEEAYDLSRSKKIGPSS